MSSKDRDTARYVHRPVHAAMVIHHQGIGLKATTDAPSEIAIALDTPRTTNMSRLPRTHKLHVANTRSAACHFWPPSPQFFRAESALRGRDQVLPTPILIPCILLTPTYYITSTFFPNLGMIYHRHPTMTGPSRTRGRPSNGIHHRSPKSSSEKEVHSLVFLSLVKS